MSVSLMFTIAAWNLFVLYNEETHTCLVMLGCLKACVSLGIFKSQTLFFVSVLLCFFTQFLEKVFTHSK